mmetsp:Transcript_99009/g.284568  ORF Transcript_99009/g.284568 Transcript_99009/m.284568 type:complete len:437 (+) Transcript_99009:78-1388(+)
MGSYLSQPVTTKETESGSGGGFEWNSSEMQGWRVGMEDAHFAVTGLQGREGEGAGEDTIFALFGVFDGHGGREVAHFCKAHLPNIALSELRSRTSSRQPQDTTGIQTKEVSEALVRTFNKMDELMSSPEYEQEILSLKGGTGDQEGASGSGRRAARPGVQQVQDRLHAAVALDMARARERGTLSTQEAMRIMKGTALIQRLEGATSALATAAAPPSGMAAHGVGCTAVCALVTSTHVVCANAGDSRAVLSRRGQTIELSWDHKPNNKFERRRIEDAGGMVKEVTSPASNGRKSRTQYRVNGDLNLSRALGDLRHKSRSDLRPDQQPVTSTPDVHIEVRSPDDEFLVLACDGIWDMKTNAEVCAWIRAGIVDKRPMQEVIEDLLDACLSPDPKATQGLGGDNMTCLVVKFEGADVKVAESSRRSVGCGFCLRFPGIR